MYLILSEYTDIEIRWYSAQLTLHLDLFSLATDISSNNIMSFTQRFAWGSWISDQA